jgi:protein-S-isoprenylcysteine O-methyltransferase Ste14
LPHAAKFVISRRVTSIERWLPVAVVLAIYTLRMIELRAKRETVPGPVRERTTLRLFVFAGTAMIAGGIAEYLAAGRSLDWIFLVPGAACGVASFAIRRRAIRALGEFWSLHVEIRESHRFVREGPFQSMRHPTYFSMILELLAVGVILRSWVTLALVGLVFVPSLLWRLRIEEAALVEKFGAAYRSYQRSTPALFPFKGRVTT